MLPRSNDKTRDSRADISRPKANSKGILHTIISSTMIDDMTSKIDDTGPRIARRIRLERSARGWSLADLAESSGVAKATISKIEREEMSPTAVTLVRLAAAFDLTLAGLLVRAEDKIGRASCRERV